MESISQDIPSNIALDSTINQKFCKFCGGKIHQDAVLCTLCGRQVEQLQYTQSSTPNIAINNTSSNVNTNQNTNSSAAIETRQKNKWVALALCLFLGVIGGHKFYEGKVGMGILYLFTFGLFTFGVIVDFITLLFKPNPYYV